MRLWHLFDRAGQRRLFVGVALLALSAFAVAAQIVVINKAALHTRSTAFQVVAGLVFLALLGAGLLLRWRGSTAIMTVVEATLDRRRRGIVDRIRATELRAFEQIEGVDAGFARDLEEIGALSAVLIDWLVYAALLLGMGLYMLSLSTVGACIWLATTGVLAWHLGRDKPGIDAAIDEVDGAWRRHRGLVDAFAHGFAQLKMHAAAADGVEREIDAAGRALDGARRRRFEHAHRWPVVATTIFYLGLGVTLFSPLVARAVEPAARFEMVTLMFFSMTAVMFLARESSAFFGADAAIARLDALDARLAAVASAPAPAAAPPARFSRIELSGVRFSYRDGAREGFTVGPIDLAISPGEAVFITGSNGSGKTTLMKLLTGLYRPDAGFVALDGAPIGERDRERYRGLFTAVFMEHHLFAPAYGLDPVDPARVEALLARFNLDGVVSFEDGRFTPLTLSTGQRKRLAMVVALLEDRPVYVLDEWAAHQDPDLRRDFYERLLPELRAAGKAVIAISHDARFFHLADRRLHLVDGRLAAAE
ncbi:MAG: ATP-binding cassette domain-containing protein [Myxococcales bacterium]|nr:ATP-binding cassette domain-containing protein [Myxococcales bacterium]MCB9543857.1 ATP-binding cassette domain-containing protein [Myxococcales bacterium]MCB9553276.1 ATP-binding cassette domain-containing protein [Myxococcales bacterium]